MRRDFGKFGENLRKKKTNSTLTSSYTPNLLLQSLSTTPTTQKRKKKKNRVTYKALIEQRKEFGEDGDEKVYHKWVQWREEIKRKKKRALDP